MTLESYVTYKSVSNTFTLYELHGWQTRVRRSAATWLSQLALATPLLLYRLSRMLTNDAAKWCTDNVGSMFTRGREASRCPECQQFVHCHSLIRAILFIQVYNPCIVLSCSIVDLSTKSKFVNKFFVDASQRYTRIVFRGKVLFIKKNTFVCTRLRSNNIFLGYV